PAAALARPARRSHDLTSGNAIRPGIASAKHYVCSPAPETSLPTAIAPIHFDARGLETARLCSAVALALPGAAIPQIAARSTHAKARNNFHADSPAMIGP